MNRLSLVCVDAQGDRAGILTCLWANFLRLLGAGEDFYVTEMLRNTPLTLILQSTTVHSFDFRTMWFVPTHREESWLMITSWAPAPSELGITMKGRACCAGGRCHSPGRGLSPGDGLQTAKMLVLHLTVDRLFDLELSFQMKEETWDCFPPSCRRNVCGMTIISVANLQSTYPVLGM
jgi:hypothetical protein